MAASQASGGDGEVRTQVRCLVVDDHAAVREGVKMILTRDREISVIGESSSGDGAVDMAEKQAAAVIDPASGQAPLAESVMKSG